MSEPKSEYKVEVKNLTKYFGDLHVLNDFRPRTPSDAEPSFLTPSFPAPS